MSTLTRSQYPALSAAVERSSSRMQDLLLAAYILFLPVQVEVTSSLRLAPSDFFLLMILAAYLLGLGRFRLPAWAWSGWHFGLIVVLLMASVVALVRTGHLIPEVLLNKDAGLLVLLATYAVVVSRVDTWGRMVRLLRLLILGVFAWNIVSLVVFFASRMAGFELARVNMGDARLSGMMVDPNAYGGLLVLVLSIHIVSSMGRRPPVRGVLGALASITLIMGLFLTYSRSAWMGLAALLIVVAGFRPRTLLSLLLIGVAVVALVLGIFGMDYLPTMSALTTRQSQIESRMNILGEAVPLFHESPLIGVGLGVFVDRHGIIIHNTSAWFLTECGVLGFAAFAGFMLWFVYQWARAYRWALPGRRPLILGLMTANVSMIALSMGIEAFYQRHWWLVLALIASSYGLARRDRERLLTYAAARR